MKKLMFMILMFSITTLFAQERKFSINTNIANFAAKGPSLSLEYQFSNKWSIQGYLSTGEINVVNNYTYKTAIIDFKRKLINNFILQLILDTLKKTYIDLMYSTL